MKQAFAGVFVLAFAVGAIAQEKETTTVKTTTTTVKSSFDLLGGETFNVTDATTFEEGAVDLRLATRYAESALADDGEVSKSWTITPVIVWGASDRLELSIGVPLNHVENFNSALDGNYDTNIGGQYRFTEQEGHWPALALAGNLRIPTGDGSSGVDYEMRLVLSNDWENGLRSHFNLFGEITNGNNLEPWDQRDFQYGAVIGVDGPLCADGAVRWVADYMYRISEVEGGGGQNIGEAGWQWQINDTSKLGMSVQLSLDRAEDASDVGAALTYAYTIRP